MLEIQQDEQGKFREMAEALPMIVWTALPDGRTDFVNHRWYEYTGISKSASIEWAWLDALHPDDVEPAMKRWRECLASGKHYDVQYRFRRASDGEYRWHLVRAETTRSPDGTITKWVGTSTDIHDHKLAMEALKKNTLQREAIEKALQEQRVLFDSFMENLPLVVFMKDEFGRQVFMNKAMDEQTCLNRSEQMGKSISEVLPPELSRSIEANDRLVLESNELKEFLEIFPNARGELCPWLVFKFPFIDSAGRKYVGGAAVNIKEREEIKEELQRAKLEYETIFNSVESSILYKDISGRVLRANPRAALLFGMLPEEMEGKLLCEIMPPGYEKAYGDDTQVVTTGSPELGILIPISQGASEKRWLKVDKLPYRDASGRVVGLIIFSTDVTEIKRLLDQREDVMHAVAHDLKVPVIGAQRALSILHEGVLGELTEPQKTMIHKLMESNVRLLDMIQTLIEVHRYEQSGQSPPKLAISEMDLVSVIDTCLSEVHCLVTEKNLQLNKKLPSRLTLHADNMAIHRLVMNLLGNAIKFTPDGGTIDVTLDRSGNNARFTVRNTGLPISPEEQKLLFQRFYRGTASSKYGAGSGMGLYLCRQISEAHNGKITCTSDLHEGTTFTAMLPIRRKEKAQTSRAND